MMILSITTQSWSQIRRNQILLEFWFWSNGYSLLGIFVNKEEWESDERSDRSKARFFPHPESGRRFCWQHCAPAVTAAVAGATAAAGWSEVTSSDFVGGMGDVTVHRNNEFGLDRRNRSEMLRRLIWICYARLGIFFLLFVNSCSNLTYIFFTES